MTLDHGTPFDVAVVGAGVVGCAIARELSRYELRVALIDAAPDVGTGTSRANTALLHTGFDARPGSLEARLVARGHGLLSAYASEAGIPLEKTGALMVAWDEQQRSSLDDYRSRSEANGYRAARVVDAAELYRLEPGLAPGAVGALHVPDESIVCSFTPPLAFATQAVLNGVELMLDTPVERIDVGVSEPHVLWSRGRRIASEWLVNAAGLYADELDHMMGYERFRVTPRRGELIVFDKLARQLVNHIVLPVPTPISKGVLVAPTVYGNVLLGPTAEDVDDKDDWSSTVDGITSLLDKGARIVPRLVDEEVTAVYAGLRAAIDGRDYEVHVDAAQNYACVGGIRSTGLTSSMALADHVVEGMGACGFKLREKDEFRSVTMPNIGEASLRRYRSEDAISRRADYGRIVCHCERVTRGEIIDACSATIPARSLDGVRRRTRALMGRCQGFFCLAEVASVLAHETGTTVADVMGLRESE